MKLTNLNCPQCNGFLKQERDMFFCESCGAAFVVDYDEHDVKYTELVTEAERTKMLLARDIDIMQTRYQLKETLARNEAHRENTKQTKKAVTTALKGSLSYILIFGVGTILLVIALVWGAKKMDARTEQNNAVKNEEYAQLVEDVAKSEIFIDNAIAYGRSLEYLTFRTATVTDSEATLPNGTAHLVGDPEIRSVYLLSAEKSRDARVLLVYKFVYEYDDSEETFELYHPLVLKDIERNRYGDLTFKYENMTRADQYGTGPNDMFYEEDQLYRQCIFRLRSKVKVTEIELPEKVLFEPENASADDASTDGASTDGAAENAAAIEGEEADA